MSKKQQGYSLSEYERLPEWLKRSWNIYKRASLRADFQSDIVQTKSEIKSGAKALALEVIRIQKQYGLGQGMDKLLIELLTQDKPTEEELLNKVSPPIRFINHGVGKILPSSDPNVEYETNERLDKFFTQRGHSLSRDKAATYLLIPPHTTKDEIKTFLDEHFDEAQSEMINIGEVYFESDRNTKKRITKPSQEEAIDERIYELRAGGTRPKEIAPIIYNEFGKELESFEISKRLNQMKRRKNRQ